jgi:hypothetical protein
MVEPDATPAFTVTMKVKFAGELAARLPMVQVRVGGKLQVQPAEPVKDCAVVLAGRVSLNVTVLAAAGPALVAVCV